MAQFDAGSHNLTHIADIVQLSGLWHSEMKDQTA